MRDWPALDLKGDPMTLSWFAIVRLGLIQMCIGAVVVLMTSTLNRLMVVELSLPALLPGFLVALHYGVQLTRPNWGYLSDIGGKRSFWVNTGMVLLVLGAILAALAIGVFEHSFAAGLILSMCAYTLIGFGVGAAGTSVLALLGSFTAPHRRAACGRAVSPAGRRARGCRTGRGGGRGA